MMPSVYGAHMNPMKTSHRARPQPKLRCQGSLPHWPFISFSATQNRPLNDIPDSAGDPGEWSPTFSNGLNMKLYVF